MTHYPRDSSYKFRCSLTSYTTDNFYQHLGQLPYNCINPVNTARLLTGELPSHDQPAIDPLQLTHARTDVILSPHTPISSRLDPTIPTTAINPGINRARKRTRITGLEHTLLRKSELAGRSQRTTCQNRDHTMAQHFKSTKTLHLNPRRMHIEVSLSRSLSHLLGPHKDEAHRVLDHPISHETIRQPPQTTFGRPSPRQRQLDGASVRTEAERPQNGRLIFFARETTDRQQAHDRRLIPTTPTINAHIVKRNTIRENKKPRRQRQRGDTTPRRLRGTLERAAAIEDEALPHLKNRTIEDDAAVEVHGGRQVFRMNMIGRQSRHTTSARTPSNDSLQHKRLLQMHHVRPVERPVNLATIRTSKGVALRGNEWRNERNTKVWKRIVRSTNTTIVTVTRRGRQHANIVPPRSQEHDDPTRGCCKPITARIQVINDEQDLELGG